MIRTILKMLGIKISNPLLVEYRNMILSGFALIGIGLYIDGYGWILFGSSNVLIYFSASVYAYKTKRKHPIFDILWNASVVIATILTAINFRDVNLFIVIASIIAAILSSYALYKQIKKASLKQ